MKDLTADSAEALKKEWILYKISWEVFCSPAGRLQDIPVKGWPICRDLVLLQWWLSRSQLLFLAHSSVASCQSSLPPRMLAWQVALVLSGSQDHWMSQFRKVFRTSLSSLLLHTWPAMSSGWVAQGCTWIVGYLHVLHRDCCSPGLFFDLCSLVPWLAKARAGWLSNAASSRLLRLEKLCYQSKLPPSFMFILPNTSWSSLLLSPLTKLSVSVLLALCIAEIKSYQNVITVSCFLLVEIFRAHVA